jgi:regulator of Ty1 transposition protein 103
VAESIALAYKAAPQNIRGKLAHVVGVWRERNIFELPVQAAVEARIQGSSLAMVSGR